jgi:hypothetical protein
MLNPHVLRLISHAHLRRRLLLLLRLRRRRRLLLYPVLRRARQHRCVWKAVLVWTSGCSVCSSTVVRALSFFFSAELAIPRHLALHTSMLVESFPTPHRCACASSTHVINKVEPGACSCGATSAHGHIGTVTS